ncbi:MAG: MerR family transcriptional regulator [Anaerolineae bacterium]
MADKKNSHQHNQNNPSHLQNGNANGLKVKSKAKVDAVDRLSPTYNLKAVVNETGLKPDTLRAWERRYGLPNPHRTAGGHRLYSQRDVDLLKWLINRQEEGLSISRAVDLWNQIEGEGRDPLKEAKSRSTQHAETSPTIAPVRNDNLATLRQSWIEACYDFDERRADSVLAEAFALFPTETVCFRLLQRGLAEIGMGWYEGHVTVQQEHFASALAIRRLETMMASTPPPTRNGRILTACPADERHTFSLLLITLLLRRNGWDVVYLGANVPGERLASTLDQAEPHLVLLAAQTLHTASTMLKMAKLLQEERVVTAFGGAVFNSIPELSNMMPGYFLGNQIETVPQVVEQLLTNRPPMPVYDQASDSYINAMEHFLDRQAQIEAKVWELTDGTSDQKYLKNANRELGQNIIAALTFGNMDLMQANLEWVHGLLINYHFRMPDTALKMYLEAYNLAVNEHLDERGIVIKEWFQNFN